MKMLNVAVMAAVLSGCVGSADLAPHTGSNPRTKTVHANVLVSKRMPASRFVLPEGAEYIGSTRFDLKGVADAEIHLFVETDAQGVVERAYWIQFESYLPSIPDATYEFASRGWPEVSLGDMELYYRPRFGRSSDQPEPGSEAERVTAMVDAAGYRFPDETYSAQFHQLVSDDARSEILFIFIGDLNDIGLTFEGIIAGGQEGEPYRSLGRRALEQAQEHIAIEPEN